MRIVANYTAFYGADFIEYSLSSIYDYVDKIQIALGEKSWPNTLGDRLLTRIDNIEEKIDHFMKNKDPKGKITLFKGIWADDTEQRNFLLSKVYDDFDYAMIIDTDEVWDTPQIKRLIDFLKYADKYRVPFNVCAVGLLHYYRSLFYRAEFRGQQVIYIYRLEDDIEHRWIRHPGFKKKDVEPLIYQIPDCYYHHFGYAYPSKIIKNKTRYWGHNAEVQDQWFEDIYTKWSPDKEMIGPVRGDLWGKPTKCTPPPIMKDHPFTKFEIIP